MFNRSLQWIFNLISLTGIEKIKMIPSPTSSPQICVGGKKWWGLIFAMQNFASKILLSSFEVNNFSQEIYLYIVYVYMFEVCYKSWERTEYKILPLENIYDNKSREKCTRRKYFLSQWAEKNSAFHCKIKSFSLCINITSFSG